MWHVTNMPVASQLSIPNLHKHPLRNAKEIRGKPYGPFLTLLRAAGERALKLL